MCLESKQETGGRPKDRQQQQTDTVGVAQKKKRNKTEPARSIQYTTISLVQLTTVRRERMNRPIKTD